MIGYLMFRLADRELACRLDEVREVVRLEGVEKLPGMVAPISGVLELRGQPLPIVDLRSGDAETRAAMRGEVLVLATGVDAMGVVVDQVTAVIDDDELERTGEERPSGLPSYVVEVLRKADPAGNTGRTILLVDVRQLLAIAA